MVTGLQLANCRSLEDKTISLGSRTVIIGDNGTGKSTVVEALRLLSVGKSFRTSRLDELITFSRRYFRVTAKRLLPPEQIIDFFYGQPFSEQATKDRVLTVNGKAVSFLDFVGQFPSVLFVPSDIEIVMGMPQVRRRYLDGVLWQVDRNFRADYLDITRVLRERSALLFLLKVNRAGIAELQPWNELLTQLTQRIREKRLHYVAYLKKALQDPDLVASTKLKFDVHYEVAAENVEAVQKQEITLAQNLFGPHRDDLEINLNQRSARKFASRGQARTAVMLLKILESKFLASQLSCEPLILLDDMFSELDQTNSRFLFDHISPESQVIATSIAVNPLLHNWQVVELQ